MGVKGCMGYKYSLGDYTHNDRYTGFVARSAGYLWKPCLTFGNLALRYAHLTPEAKKDVVRALNARYTTAASEGAEARDAAASHRGGRGPWRALPRHGWLARGPRRAHGRRRRPILARAEARPGSGRSPRH